MQREAEELGEEGGEEGEGQGKTGGEGRREGEGEVRAVEAETRAMKMVVESSNRTVDTNQTQASAELNELDTGGEASKLAIHGIQGAGMKVTEAMGDTAVGREGGRKERQRQI